MTMRYSRNQRWAEPNCSAFNTGSRNRSRMACRQVQRPEMSQPNTHASRQAGSTVGTATRNGTATLLARFARNFRSPRVSYKSAAKNPAIVK